MKSTALNQSFFWYFQRQLKKNKFRIESRNTLEQKCLIMLNNMLNKRVEIYIKIVFRKIFLNSSLHISFLIMVKL